MFKIIVVPFIAIAFSFSKLKKSWIDSLFTILALCIQELLMVIIIFSLYPASFNKILTPFLLAEAVIALFSVFFQSFTELPQSIYSADWHNYQKLPGNLLGNYVLNNIDPVWIIIFFLNTGLFVFSALNSVNAYNVVVGSLFFLVPTSFLTLGSIVIVLSIPLFFIHMRISPAVILHMLLPYSRFPKSTWNVSSGISKMIFLLFSLPIMYLYEIIQTKNNEIVLYFLLNLGVFLTVTFLFNRVGRLKQISSYS